jgi:hypothetical protein
MLKKIIGVLLKVILGLAIFYLVLGFIIIPLAMAWAIPSQGSKFLKHPVHLRSVEFNPLLLQLTMDGFEVQDQQNQVMLGFDRMFVDVSFVDLLKKIYHVEAFEINGLKINVELLSGNQINLLGLVPPELLAAQAAPAKKSAKVVQKQEKLPVSTGQSVPLPVVIVDSIDLHQGQLVFTDKTISPNFSTKVSAIELHITHVTTNPQDESKIKFHADLDDKGKIAMEAIIKPLAQPLEMETTFSLNGYALDVLTPYVGKYTGRELKDGKLDLNFDYTIGGNKLTATHKLIIQRFEFGKSVASKDALHLPFGLAVALLEDPDGRIKIALPASGDMSDPKFQYKHLIFQVVRNFFINLVTKPFSFLTSALGSSDQGTDEMGYVRFSPGKATLSDSQKKKLITLIHGLKQHPKLRLEIDGSYDPQVDWKEIQAEVFTRDYEKLRKESDRSESKVYQLLYQRRFGIRALWVLAKKYKEGIGKYKEEMLDGEIKHQLIENAPADENALSVLAQARAQGVHDFFVANGFEEARLSSGRPQSTQSSMGYVPLPFTLTVFDNVK